MVGNPEVILANLSLSCVIGAYAEVIVCATELLPKIPVLYNFDMPSSLEMLATPELIAKYEAVIGLEVHVRGTGPQQNVLFARMRLSERLISVCLRGLVREIGGPG